MFPDIYVDHNILTYFVTYGTDKPQAFSHRMCGPLRSGVRVVLSVSPLSTTNLETDK